MNRPLFDWQAPADEWARRGVTIHPTAVVYPGVHIGPGSTVGPYCIVGSEDGQMLWIDRGATIRSHSIIYGGSTIGQNLETGHHTLIRSGNTIGTNLRIGSYSSLEGGGQIGDYVRIHGRCEMTKGRLLDFARIYGGTYVTDNRRPPSRVNDPVTVGVGAVVCMNTVLVAGITLGDWSYVGAGMVVTENVPAHHIVYIGRQPKPLRQLWPEYDGSILEEYPAEARARIVEAMTAVRIDWSSFA